MTAFATAAAGPLRADPSKRVNYTLGLVLGVDEFQQDQLYHTAGRRWHNRLLHGYGTVWGLRVTTPAPGEADPEIRVTQGVAIDPCGREICVPDTMCVRVNAWLERHRAPLQAIYGAGPASIPLAVVLCHRECPDDLVPVPGEPCRSQDDAMQPSRIRESFELRLALRDEAPWDSPPADNPGGLTLFRFSQPEEEAVRAFGRLLDRVRVECRGAPAGGRAALLAAVRQLAALAEAAELGSPPEYPDWILLDEAEADAAVREAIRVWATEVRPLLRAREPVKESCGCPAGADDCCVLLAEVDLPVTASWTVQGTDFPPDEDKRPVLLHTRLLQEWLTRAGEECCCAEVDTFVTAAPIATDTVRLWLHHPDALSVHADAVTVVVNGGAAVPPGSLTPVVGMVNVFDLFLNPGANDGDVVEARLDLTRITEAGSAPADIGGDCPTGGLLDRHGPEVSAFVVFREQAAVLPALGGDVIGPVGGNSVVRIRGVTVSPAAPAAGQVLAFTGGQWTPTAPAAAALPPASGDVSGTYPALTVTRIQTRPVANQAPANNQVLTWNGAQWIPAGLPPFPNAGGDATGAVAALTVTRLQSRPVSGAAPAVGQVLAWDGAQWAPAAAGGGGGVLGGDVAGPAGGNTINAIQGVKVDAPGPKPGHYLRFFNDAWRSDFAVQAINEPYAIVAAGNFARSRAEGVVFGALTNYNDTEVVDVQPGTPMFLTIKFKTFDRQDDPNGYIVKGHVIDAESARAWPLVLSGVTEGGVVVAVNTGQNGFDRLTLEISRIGRGRNE
ncbi:MAG TPA: hypothetical protein VFQ39_06975 [Longimicrobium sp.]|nr:hypothetical protein [Longimicrobium sp.]